jgi:transcriptional regulator with XRE-family HTH domain
MGMAPAMLVRRPWPIARLGCMRAMDRRLKELAAFLRSRRERLTPVAAGLPSGQRRRTPGLRREEVAELAGIGTGWYTFLEQGRDVRPSEGALRRIAHALQLDPAEKKYLSDLALESAPRTRGEEMITPLLRGVVTRMAYPALILGQRWDLLEYNQAANAVFDLDYVPDRNFLRLAFTDEVRVLCPNWECAARQCVNAFRADNACFLRDPWITSVVDQLTRDSPEFRAWWTEQAVCEMNSGHVTLDHPFVGRLELEFAMLQPRDSPNLTVRVYDSRDKETRTRIDELIRQHRSSERSSSHNAWSALGARALRRAASRAAIV